MKYERIKPGTYRFEVTIKASEGEKTFTLYRNVKTKRQADLYLQALIDLVDVQGSTWSRARWEYDAINE